MIANKKHLKIVAMVILQIYISSEFGNLKFIKQSWNITAIYCFQVDSSSEYPGED